jgi:hypothetical protein
MKYDTVEEKAHSKNLIGAFIMIESRPVYE